MPRFVILEHDHPELHWDFMLETENNLRTWKLLKSPDLLCQGAIKAEASFNHRLLYLDYEGPISDNRGSVKRFDYGTFEWLEQTDKRITVCLKGTKFNNQIQLLQCHVSDPNIWEFRIAPHTVSK